MPPLASLALALAAGMATTTAATQTLRPEDFGCKPDGVTLCSPGIRKAVASW